MRFNEQNGKDYHFLDHDEFLTLKSKNHFFEVTSYNSNYYGSPQSCIDQLSHGRSFIAITDRAGIQSYKNRCNDVIPIWISPPSVEILHHRLTKRGTENPNDLKRRCDLGAQEYEEEIRNPLCQHLIVNQEVDSSTNELVSIIKNCLLDKNK
jgi:guanylate kinase